jgi:hypothetical protein
MFLFFLLQAVFCLFSPTLFFRSSPQMYEAFGRGFLYKASSMTGAGSEANASQEFEKSMRR